MKLQNLGDCEGNPILVNPDHVLRVERNPDDPSNQSLIIFVDGKSVCVKGDLDHVKRSLTT